MWFLFRFFMALSFFKNRPKAPLLSTIRSSYRVRLLDLDANGHMNNVKYMKYLERGRVELMVQTPWLNLTYGHKARTLIANAEINYIKELKPFQPFTVETRISAWDDRYVYIEQRFMNNDVIFTTAASRMAIVDRRTHQRISPLELFASVLPDSNPPSFPKSVYHFNQMIQSQRQETEAVMQHASTTPLQHDSV